MANIIVMVSSTTTRAVRLKEAMLRDQCGVGMGFGMQKTSEYQCVWGGEASSPRKGLRGVNYQARSRRYDSF